MKFIFIEDKSKYNIN